MTYKQAQKLKPGDKVKQKMHGYEMTVDRVEESFFTTNKFINIYCRLDSGEIMKHNHKEIMMA